MLTDDKKCELQPKIIEYLSTEIVDNVEFSGTTLEIKFNFNPQHIIESKLPQFGAEDIILWHPQVAGNNLDIMKKYTNSIVILQAKTLYLQKISKYNPITENMAINHEFKIIYIDPEKEDISNEDWQLILSENHYTITKNKLINLIQSKLWKNK